MPHSSPIDGFSLAYDRAGDGPAAVLLHGWPGWRADYRDVVPLLSPHADVVVPDLRGFGESDRHDRPPKEAYSAEAQAASVLGLIEELGLDRPVLFGYDVGCRVARDDRRRRGPTRSARSCSPRRCPAPASGSCTPTSSGTSRSTACACPTR